LVSLRKALGFLLENFIGKGFELIGERLLGIQQQSEFLVRDASFALKGITQLRDLNRKRTGLRALGLEACLDFLQARARRSQVTPLRRELGGLPTAELSKVRGGPCDLFERSAAWARRLSNSGNRNISDSSAALRSFALFNV
jgi:hypothetical protein